MVNVERITGSTSEFDSDWRQVLANEDPRYLIYPARDSGHQADLMEWIKAQQVEALLKEAGIKPDASRILEYGCGAAGISLYLAKQGYRCHLSDLSPYALKVAQRNHKVNANQAQIASETVANTLQLPYATGTFDVVMSYGLLEHFEMAPLHQLLDETIRVLKPGGLFIADIVPGPERVNVRTLGLLVNYLGSLGMHLLTGKWAKIRSLYRQYFEYYYETPFDDRKWLNILSKHHLGDLKVDVCRPFPPLALSGSLEKAYTNAILNCRAFHQRFDGANNWLTRRWGWMYLASGRKEGQRGRGGAVADVHKWESGWERGRARERL